MTEYRLTPAAERDLEGIAIIRILHDRMDAPRYV